MATNIISSLQKPDILDAAAKEVLKIPNAVGTVNAGKMCLSASGIVYWRGKGPMPDPARQAIGEELLSWLNREVWLDGQWVVCWADYDVLLGHYKRMAWCFLDKQNDLIFQIDNDEPIEIQMFAISDFVEQALASYLEVKSLEKDLGITADDKIAAALGQKSADEKAQPFFVPMQMD